MSEHESIGGGPRGHATQASPPGGAAAQSGRRPVVGRLLEATFGGLVGLGLLGALLLVGLALEDPASGWAERRGALVAVEAGPWLRREADEYRELRLTASSGLTFEMTVLRPLEPGPWPTLLVLGGHRTGRDAVHLVPRTEHVVVAAVSYPYTGDHHAKGLELVRSIPAIRAGLADAVPALRLAVDHLEAEPYVDAERLELVGVSLGAIAGTGAGALDERFARVWVVHAGAGTRRLFEHALARKVGATLPRKILALLASVLSNGSQLAPERWLASIAPRELILVNARDDRQLPPASIEELQRRAPAGAQRIWTEGGHVTPSRTAIVQALLTMIFERARADAGAPAAGYGGVEGG